MIVGLGHYAGTGKDTAADMLVERGFTKVSVAALVREFVYAIDPTYRQLVDDYGYEAAKRTHPAVRQRLVAVGETGRRMFGPDIWLNALTVRLDPHRSYVIPDVRYGNEARWVRDQDGVLVKITRPGVRPGPDAADQSLVRFHEWDLVIDNAGTMDDLRAAMAVVA